MTSEKAYYRLRNIHQTNWSNRTKIYFENTRIQGFERVINQGQLTVVLQFIQESLSSSCGHNRNARFSMLYLTGSRRPAVAIISLNCEPAGEISYQKLSYFNWVQKPYIFKVQVIPFPLKSVHYPVPSPRRKNVSCEALWWEFGDRCKVTVSFIRFKCGLNSATILAKHR